MLDRALETGITEANFWDMTIAEIQRAVAASVRVEKRQAQQKATFDYILANLIVKGVSKCLGDKSTYPTLEEAYPELFTDMQEEKERQIQERKDNLSALRFKQFAQSYNSNFKNKEVPDNNK